MRLKSLCNTAFAAFWVLSGGIWLRQAGKSQERSRHRPDAKTSYSGIKLGSAGFDSGGYLMPPIHSDQTIPSIVPSNVPSMSDEECLVRLARAVKDHDDDKLDEIARLIARLAVPIE
jgi:hypothetical protein